MFDSCFSISFVYKRYRQTYRKETSFYIIVDMREQVAIILTNDLFETVSDRANFWLVAFNPSKMYDTMIITNT